MKRTFGRYELKSSKRGEVGENVFFGTDLELKRPIAIKEIKQVNAARSEAIALAACGPHESIPVIYDFFTCCSKGYIVMEYVKGHELGGDQNGRPNPQEKAVALTINILHALRHIHSKGYLHLDIKPKNVMVTNEATSKIKLIDFGGAVLKKPSGFFKGKPKAGYPPYMPSVRNPEYTGHLIRKLLDTQSGFHWTLNPEMTGQ